MDFCEMRRKAGIAQDARRTTGGTPTSRIGPVQRRGAWVLRRKKRGFRMTNLKKCGFRMTSSEGEGYSAADGAGGIHQVDGLTVLA